MEGNIGKEKIKISTKPSLLALNDNFIQLKIDKNKEIE